MAMKPLTTKTNVSQSRDPAVITISVAILGVLVLVCAIIVGIALWSAVIDSSIPFLANP